MSRLRVCTFNVGNTGAAKMAADLEAVRAVADVVCLQEVSDREALIDPTEEWAVYQPNGHNREHNAITWRRAMFDAAGTASTQMLYDKKSCGESGAGGNPVKTCWLHHVVLHHTEAKRRVNIFATHMVPSVQGRAASPAGKKCRQGLFKKAIRGIVVKVNRTLRGQVFVAADWNCTPGDRLMRPLGLAGLNLGYPPKPTHGRKRAIDLVYHRRSLVVTVMGQKHVFGIDSDHEAVVITYELKERGST